MKELIKAIMAVICFVLLIPLFILYFIRLFSFMSCAQLLSLVPGFFGVVLRRVWYKCTLAHCGKKLVIEFLSTIRTKKSRIDDNVYIGINSRLGWVEIGADTMIADHAIVLSGSGQHGAGKLNVPMRLQKGEEKKTVIGKDCWIGSETVIMANVAQHSIVGAGSVVTKTFAPYDILAGVPAKKIKSRKK